MSAYCIGRLGSQDESDNRKEAELAAAEARAAAASAEEARAKEAQAKKVELEEKEEENAEAMEGATYAEQAVEGEAPVVEAVPAPAASGTEDEQPVPSASSLPSQEETATEPAAPKITDGAATATEPVPMEVDEVSAAATSSNPVSQPPAASAPAPALVVGKMGFGLGKKKAPAKKVVANVVEEVRRTAYWWRCTHTPATATLHEWRGSHT